MLKGEQLQIDGLKKKRRVLRKERDLVIKRIDNQEDNFCVFGKSLDKWKKILKKEEDLFNSKKKELVGNFCIKKTALIRKTDALKSELSGAREIIDLAAKKLRFKNCGQGGEALLNKIIIKME